ncbi:MAG: aspartate kinase [Chloroflexi bacterium]|nr:aspartate kinase [Chloroflexota bacterium]
MRTLIMKFGGSSVGMTAGLTQVVSIVLNEHERWDRLLLVVSALDGVTDSLTEAIQLARLGNQRGYRRIIANLRTRHFALADQLNLTPTEHRTLDADMDRLLYDMLTHFQRISDHLSEAEQLAVGDAITSVGERLAARIVAALLRQHRLRSVALDATDLIITDDKWGGANPLMEPTRSRLVDQLMPLLESRITPVITGFIGATLDGRPTTLGRGGSDYTASILAECASADAVWLWTDVEGLLTADPDEVSTPPQVIPALTYEQSAELAYFGARVLHPRMIGPLRTRTIPLQIKSVFKPQQAGTLVTDHIAEASSTLQAVTMIQGIGVHGSQSGILTPLLTRINEVFVEVTGAPIEVTISAQSSQESFICFVVPTTAGLDAPPTLAARVGEALARSATLSQWTAQIVQVITVIGAHFDTQHHYAADLMRLVEGLPLLAIARGPAHCSLSLVFAPEDSARALDHIHNYILGRRASAQR